jgi:peptidoglycan/LPS O-acetylase OafA/YrhL
VVNIQVLRGVAALMVVLYHVSQRLDRFAGPIPGFTDAAHYGRFGVDIFFVISGFIMAHIGEGRPKDSAYFRQFLKHRLIRIMPLYWIVSALVLAVFLARPELVNAGSGRPQVLLSLLLVPNHSSFLVGVAWTLSHEMFFYLLFAFLGLLFGERGTVLTGAAIVLLTLAGAVTRLAQPQTANPVWDMVSHSVNLGFVGGLLCERLYRDSQGGRLGWAAIGAGVGLIVVYILVGAPLGEASPAWDLARGILFGVPATLIVLGALQLEARDARASLPAAVRLGDISYSLYLIHILAISAVGVAWVKLGLAARLPVTIAPAALLGLSLAAALVAGYGLWRFVERPMIRLCQRWLEGRRERATSNPAMPGRSG